MADKHVLTLEILREYGVDLSVPREVEFNIVSLFPIDENVVQDFAAGYGWQAEVEKVEDLHLATLTARLIIAKETIRPLSEAVERFSNQHGWDYDGWGAFNYK
jgi:hypothetical protein